MCDPCTGRREASRPEPEESIFNVQEEVINVRTTYGDTAVSIYNSKGDSTVFLLHGAGGTQDQFKEGRMAANLAKEFRVVTMDWIGHGNTTATSEKYTVDAFVTQLEEVDRPSLKKRLILLVD